MTEELKDTPEYGSEIRNLYRIANAVERIADVMERGYVPPLPQPPSEPELPQPGDVVPGYKWVTVIEKVPLREIYRLNDAGRPVWGIYGKRVIANRIIAKADKKLLVANKLIKGDGGKEAYFLHPDQIVDNHLLSNEKDLYVLVRHVRG
jgi:hypothetical protein